MPELGAISQLELSALRRESVDFMPDTVRVHPRTSARSGSGGTTYTTATNPSTTTKGRLAPMDKSVEQFYADRLGGRQGWTITIPDDPAVAQAASLSVFKIGTRTFQIVGSDYGRSNRITRMYDCVEMT